jgi:hypothetical protein
MPICREGCQNDALVIMLTMLRMGTVITSFQ